MLALLMIVIFVGFQLSKCHKVHSRHYLALSAMVSTVFAFTFAFGVTTMVGLEMNSIVIMIPFIVLGVGCDDMIVVLGFWDRSASMKSESGPATAVERMKYTLKEAGSAIFLTSLTACLAFGTGVPSQMPAVRT